MILHRMLGQDPRDPDISGIHLVFCCWIMVNLKDSWGRDQGNQWGSRWGSTLGGSEKELFVSMYVLSCFSCVQLFVTPMDCSPPGSSVHEILQVGIPEWVAISFSRASSQPPQGSDLSLLHCRQILDHLSHQGSPKDCYYHLWDHLIFCPKWAARTHSFQSQHFKDNKPCKSLSWSLVACSPWGR